MTTIKLIGDLILYLGAFSCIAFCLIYSLVAKWWKSEAGWHIQAWTFYTGVLLVFLSAAVSKWMSEDARMIIRAPIYLLILPLIWWRISMLVRAQRRDDLDIPETRRTPLDV